MNVISELDLATVIAAGTNLAAIGARGLNIFQTFNNSAAGGVAVTKHDDNPDQIIARVLGPGINSGRIQGCGGPIFGRNVTLDGVAADQSGYVQLLDQPIRPWGAVRGGSYEESGIAPAGSMVPFSYTPSALWFETYHLSLYVDGAATVTISLETDGLTPTGFPAVFALTAGTATGVDFFSAVSRAVTVNAVNNEVVNPLTIVIYITQFAHK